MAKTERYLRFPVAHRLEHWVLTISFFLLGLTGLVQRYMDFGPSQWFIGLFGGIEALRVWHRVAALVYMLETIYHIGAAGYRVLVKRVRMSMLPGKDDAVSAVQTLLYNLGLSKKRPHQGHFTFEEKLEYWAVVWGTIVMGITGFMLWNPIATTKILPGDIIPAAKMAHGLEAVLAVVAILIWHLYHVHIKTFNKAVFTGYVTEEEMEDEHPKALAALKAGVTDPQPDRATLARRRKIFFPVYGVLAVIMLVGVYFFVAYEETAIATVPPAEDVKVLVQLTATPIPTLAAAPVATLVPAGTVLTWQNGIGKMVEARCVTCHSSANPLSGLDLGGYSAALAGGKSGLAVVPGEPHTSLMVTRQMSGNHPGQLTPEELKAVVDWIEAGAPER